jgi:hypothetical protein
MLDFDFVRVELRAGQTEWGEVLHAVGEGAEHSVGRRPDVLDMDT